MQGFLSNQRMVFPDHLSILFVSIILIRGLHAILKLFEVVYLGKALTEGMER